jgi:hypothetical protein
VVESLMVMVQVEKEAEELVEDLLMDPTWALLV